MNESITRKDFLTGFLDYFRNEMNQDAGGSELTRSAFMLPPGAVSSEEFLSKCTQCYDCVAACPHRAIRVRRETSSSFYGYPVIDPREQPCYRCADFPCVAACEGGALVKHLQSQPLGAAVVDEKQCLSYQGLFCQACITNCPESGQAIYCNESGQPVIVPEKCTGCGMCVYSCVAEVSAIHIDNGVARNGKLR